jgi:hypothetical protein
MLLVAIGWGDCGGQVDDCHVFHEGHNTWEVQELFQEFLEFNWESDLLDFESHVVGFKMEVDDRIQ